MVTGLYAALAGSASVFVGILTALLVSNITNIKSQRDQIKRRVESINSNLPHLITQREKLEQDIEQLEDNTSKLAAANNFMVFVHMRGDEYGLGVKEDKVEEDFAEFLRVDELDEYQRQAIHMKHLQFGPEDISEGEWQQKIGSRRRHLAEENNKLHRDINRRRELETRIGSLQDELETLRSRYQSLDPANILNTLQYTVGTIVLSVVAPISAYFIRFVIDEPFNTLPHGVEPAAIVILWIAGLAIVFYQIKREIGRDSEGLPTLHDDGAEGSNTSTEVT